MKEESRDQGYDSFKVLCNIREQELQVELGYPKDDSSISYGTVAMQAKVRSAQQKGRTRYATY